MLSYFILFYILLKYKQKSVLTQVLNGGIIRLVREVYKRWDDMVSKDSLMKIRQDVENYVGQEICVKANVGRNKCIERKGYIDSTYTNLFVFRDSETDSKLSYSYSDLVTNTLELSLPTGEPITRYDFSTPKYTRL